LGKRLLKGVGSFGRGCLTVARRNGDLLVPLCISAGSLLVVLYVGVFRESPPSEFHSLGVAAENETSRGANKPFPRACRARQRSEWKKIAIPPETPASETGQLVARSLRPYADTCRTIMKPEPAPVVTSAEGRGLRMDIVVHVDPGFNPIPFTDQCGEATVDVVISGTQRFWRDHSKLHRRPTRVALGWDDRSGLGEIAGSNEGDDSLPLVALNADTLAPLHPTFFRDSDLSSYALEFGREGRAWMTELNWGGEIGKKPIHFRFVADWIEDRGVGSCYVVLPSLSANGALPGQEAAACALAQRPGEEPVSCTSEEVILDFLSHTDPPTHGRTVLSMGDATLDESAPEPNDYEAVWRPSAEHEGVDAEQLLREARFGRHAAPVWSCLPTQDLSYLRGESSSIPPAGSFTGNACGAFAIVEPPTADEIRTTIILIGSVVAAIFAERFFSVWFERRRRRNPVENQPEDSA
jgi:hypothetical protein